MKRKKKQAILHNKDLAIETMTWSKKKTTQTNEKEISEEFRDGKRNGNTRMSLN
jgi:hypothetical protein